jgi:hypothetical protein
MTFGELLAFVRQVRAAGADSTTPVMAVTPWQDTAMVIGLRVELEQPENRPCPVELERGDLAQLLAVFESIEANEGDARAELATIQALRQSLTAQLLSSV